MSISKYLTRYSAPEAALVDCLTRRVRHVVVIPACDEQTAAIEAILGDALAAAFGDGILAIVVVNGTDDHAPAIHARNDALLRALRSRPQLDPNLAVLAIDRSSPSSRLPRGQGVGLARKIGCDVALAARAAGHVTSRWIHTTDADVRLPREYFAAARLMTPTAGGLVYRFRHRTGRLSPPADRALELYELWLRYYVVGLARAGSPFATHTVGSTLAIDAEAYAAVRGFPRRQGGEDFYLVNKLAKLTQIARADPVIEIEGRPSSRVPFGTGPATRRIAAQLKAGHELTVYAPRTFELVAEWLARMSALAGGDGDALAGIDPSLAAALDSLGAVAAIEKIRDSCTSAATARKRAHEWFDGFRTLKLVHALRDRFLPEVPWRAALARWSIDGASVGAAIGALEAAEPTRAGIPALG